VLPALLVILAAYADSRGSHRLAFDALLVAVPCACVAALAAFGSFLDSRDDAVAAFQALAWAVVVLLLTLSCSVRSSAVHALPPLATSTVAACLVVFAIQLVLAAAPFLRRLASLRPAKP
jgi:hypothetical protein